MRGIVFVLAFALCLSTSAAARNGARVRYLGGTRADIPTSNSGEIRMTDDIYFVFISKHTEVKIPYERINLVEYGQKVDRRFVAAALISPVFMLLKQREHFLTVGFEDDNGRQQAMMFRLDKSDVRIALVSLEARTGRKVEFQDEESRAAGKG